MHLVTWMAVLAGEVAGPGQCAAGAVPDRAWGPTPGWVQTSLSSRMPGLTRAARATLGRTLTHAARAHDVPLSFVMALIAVESAFDVRATSPADARGLMQLLPGTGAEWAQRLGLPWDGPDTLYDPVTNVQLGIRYLRYLGDRFDDNWTQAAAAYCYGPGRMRRILGETGGLLPERRQVYPKRVWSAWTKLPAVARADLARSLDSALAMEGPR